MPTNQATPVREPERAFQYARVLNLMGVLHYYVGDHEAARPWYRASLKRRQALGDLSGQADTLNNLALVDLARGDPRRAKELSAEAVRLMRQVGDRVRLALFLGNHADILGALGQHEEAWDVLHEAHRHLRGDGANQVRANLLQRLGAVALARGQLEVARTVLANALANYRKLDEAHGVGLVLRHQSQLALHERQYSRAASYVVEAIKMGQVSEDPALIAGLLDQQAAIAVATGQACRAAILIGQADALYDFTGAMPDAFYQTERAQTLASLRSSLGEEQASALRAFGGNLPLEEAVAETVAIAAELVEPDRSAADSPADGAGIRLTRRERDVLALVAAGYTNRQIGDTLFLSHRTVATHVSNLLGKLEAPTRAAAATEAVRRGLVTP